jgi:hypothetical protein
MLLNGFERLFHLKILWYRGTVHAVRYRCLVIHRFSPPYFNFEFNLVPHLRIGTHRTVPGEAGPRPNYLRMPFFLPDTIATFGLSGTLLLQALLQIRFHMLLGLPDPDPLVRGTDPDPSMIKQK